jgi:hypothetical protein
MIQYFRASFRPDSCEEGASLAITGGRGGARLTHSHERCVSPACCAVLCCGVVWCGVVWCGVV